MGSENTITMYAVSLDKYQVMAYAVVPCDPYKREVAVYGVWPEPTITLYAVQPYKWYPCAPESDPEKEKKEIKKLKERIQKLEEILKLKAQLKKLEEEELNDKYGSITTTSIDCTGSSTTYTNKIE